MSQQEIIKDLHDLLDSHLKGGREYIGPEPYIGDFFKLFREAYQNHYFDVSSNPRLTGDALRDILRTRWFKQDGKDDQRLKLMEDLLRRWDEWRYAWDKHS